MRSSNTSHFPDSYHESILDAPGMAWVPAKVPGRRRSAEFREMILTVYEHRCAVCGFDGRLGFSDLGLEAAHVMWHAAGGPDTGDNGIALCLFHHRMLDRGALGIDREHRVTVSQQVNGGRQVRDMLIRFVGKELMPPQTGCEPPAAKFVEWHAREVFRKPARVAG